MKIKLNNNPVSWLTGKKQPDVGDYLPDFKLTNFENTIISNEDLKGKKTLLSVVPDLDTDICSLETKKFNETADKYQDINFITVSNNPVEFQKNWCAANNVNNMKIFSDVMGDFGKAMNLYIPLFKHLARVVYLVDENGKIIYCQPVKEIASEPDYDSVIQALNNIM